MKLVFVNASRNLSFSDLSTVIRQHEELLGPLRVIGPSAESTVLGFEFEVDPPHNPSHLRFAQEGTPASEYEVVASGEAYVLGHAVDVIAYRLRDDPQRVAP
jgi:hypothetical protein